MNAAQASNLGLLLTNTARLHPGERSLIHGDRVWTWAQTEERVAAMCSALRDMGLRKGDRMLVHSRNSVQMFESCWIAFRLGCVWVPTNFRLAPAEIAYIAASSAARLLIVDQAFVDVIEPIRAASAAIEHVVVVGDGQAGALSYEAMVERNLGRGVAHVTVVYDDPLWFFYTSGTTGRPKAAVLTHGQMTFVVNNHLADLFPDTTSRDCSIAVAPLSHGAGIHALGNVARGACTVLLGGDRLDPEAFWQAVEAYRVSNLFTVPTIVKMLVEHPAVDRHDHSSLRYVIYAGAPMYRVDQRLALHKLGPVLVQYFGLGEVTGTITVLPREMHSADDDDPRANIGSCGIARTGIEIGILDEELRMLPAGEVGEICCRGPAVLLAYHDNPEATARALRGGWFHTGDLGRLDERGHLYITGRLSDMYISGGSNVYPREVEEALMAHPAVAEVAVLGVPDAKWGEIGVAVVVCKPGMTVEPDALRASLEGRCARYKWPRRFVFWPDLPKSGYGKVSKLTIRERLAAGQD